jgi:drug/metabolite transporter (DMT)-like permease
MDSIKLASVMIIWGSIGVFTKTIPLSPLELAFLRALIAFPFIGAAALFAKNKGFSLKLIFPYIISGILLGVGWLALFYGFKYTSISSAIIIYNMCPVYVMIGAPILLKEKIRLTEISVIIISFAGLFCILGNDLIHGVNSRGLLLSALSGLCYASIVLLNRSIKERLPNMSASAIQIGTATLVLLPFIIGSHNPFSNIGSLTILQKAYLFLLGAIHTGLAYTLFFSVYDRMKSIRIAAFSYIEPLTAITFSIIFTGEKLSLIKILGGILILGSTYGGELLKNRRVSAKKSLRLAVD